MQTSLPLRLPLAFFSILCVALCSVAQAFDIQPLVHRIDPGSGVISSIIQVRNSTDRPLPLDISSYRLALDEGTPSAAQPADDELLAFPPAVVIKPGDTQLVRIQWIAAEPLLQDQSYLVVVEQLPQGDTRDGVQMLLAFNAVVHVSASKSQPRLEISARGNLSDETLPSLEIDLHNKGNGNAFGNSISLVLATDTERHVIKPVELANYAPDLFLPPNHQRSFAIPLQDFGTLTSATSIEISAEYQSR